MAHQEKATFPWIFEPLGAVVAEKKIDCLIVLIVRIHVFESDSDSDATEGAK